MRKKDPADRKSIDLTVQVWRQGDSIYVAGGIDPITVSGRQGSTNYDPVVWRALDKALQAQGK